MTLKKYGEMAKLPAEKRHFHVLKHSIATHPLDAGAEGAVALIERLPTSRDAKDGARRTRGVRGADIRRAGPRVVMRPAPGDRPTPPRAHGVIEVTDEQLPEGLLDRWLERVAKMDRDVLEDFIVRERRSWPPELLVELEAGRPGEAPRAVARAAR